MIDFCKLKIYLIQNGINQKGFAEKINISQPALSKILNNKSWPRKETMLKIREALLEVSNKKVGVDDIIKKGSPKVSRPSATQKPITTL